MASIYLGGTFYQFTADEVRARQNLVAAHQDAVRIINAMFGE